ncbi:MAG: TonB-dependent receptor [Bacteroidota bacterium]
MSRPLSIFLFLFCWAAPIVLYGQPVLNQTVSGQFPNTPLVEILTSIEEQISIRFAYNKKEIPLRKSFSADWDTVPIDEALTLLFTDHGIGFEYRSDQIVLFRTRVLRYTLSGYVTDRTSGEALIGANVYETRQFRGTTTNEYGFFSLTLPENSYVVQSSYTGYKLFSDTVDLVQDIDKQITLQPGTTLSAITVIADSTELKESLSDLPEAGSHEVFMEQIEQLPSLLGEQDLLKILQLYPGIQSGREGNTRLNVRGGDSGQNLILLDGVPVYNTSHLFGFFSIFNPDAINKAEVSKGGFPSRYGGRLSSVLDVRMREGNRKSFHGGISISPLAGSMYIEGPLKKEKTSFILHGRRTFLDLLISPIIDGISDSDVQARYHFADINVKINHKIASGNHLYFSIYNGLDNFRTKNAYNYTIDSRFFGETVFSSEGGWGNRIAALRWNKVVSPKLFSNTTITLSNYRFTLSNAYASASEEPDFLPYEIENEGISRIWDYGIKADFDFLPNDKHTIKFGGGYTWHNFTPGDVFTVEKVAAVADTSISNALQVESHEYFAYIEDEWQISPKLLVVAGIHLAGILVERQHYFSGQPRLSAQYIFSRNFSIKATYSRMSQFIHLLTSPDFGLPADFWVPSTAQVKPNHSNQFSAGFSLGLGKGYYLTTDLFWKNYVNLLDYQENESFFGANDNWENKVTTGKGKSYGAEILIEKKTGRLTGWLAYTLARSDRTFEAINEGREFPFRFDRRHDISLALNWKAGPKISLGAVWVYGSGDWVTIPEEHFLSLENVESGTFSSTQEPINNIAFRNNFQLPPYHRLDLSASFLKKKKRGLRTWKIGIYNAYSRNNVYTFYAETSISGGRFASQSLLGFFLPYFNYRFNF